MGRRVYLDWNATTPLRQEARAAMIVAMDIVGNPSSVHAEGRAAKAIVERARAQVSAAFGCDTGTLVFNSGASEAAAMAAPDGFGLPSAVEHDAVSNSFLGLSDVAYFPVCNCGQAEIAPVLEKLKDNTFRPSGVAIQYANSETGVLQDLESLIEQIKCVANPPEITVDAVQAAGKIGFSCNWLKADFILLSGHKIGGPKGVGALVAKAGGVGSRYATFAPNGSQEMGRRAGTENVIGIAGFGAAAEAAARDLEAGVWENVEKLRNILELGIAAASDQTIFVGKDANRLPNTSCFATPGWKGETQVMSMDLAGFAISAGSACSSGKVKESRVLRAMGYNADTARSAVRVSLGPTTTEEEIERFVDAWGAAYRKFRARAV